MGSNDSYLELMHLSSAVEIYRKQALLAAKDLRYSEDTIDSIENAETVGQIARLMSSARKEMA